MDFTGRGSQPAQPAATNSQYSGGTNAGSKKTKAGKGRDWKRLGAGGLGLLLLALVVALIATVALSSKNKESSYIDKDRLQAVFLQTGQVYFGDIKALNNNFIELENIYYLQTSNGESTASAASNANVSLVKLGCELHAPFDRMVINREQVTFWENLQADGQVAKAVETFQKDNPNGQKCADQSAAPNSNSNVQGTQNTQNAGSSNSNTSNTNSDE
ncbi:MAG TPA: hypothetical protein VGE30_01485 [Candidatus Saccharimonadales bacterium]